MEKYIEKFPHNQRFIVCSPESFGSARVGFFQGNKKDALNGVDSFLDEYSWIPDLLYKLIPSLSDFVDKHLEIEETLFMEKIIEGSCLMRISLLQI